MHNSARRGLHFHYTTRTKSGRTEKWVERCLFLPHRSLGLGFISGCKSQVNRDPRCAVSKPNGTDSSKSGGFRPHLPKAPQCNVSSGPDPRMFAAREAPRARR